jgi:hypothetical protein
MLDLSERIRDYVDAASPRVTLDDIERRLTQRSDRQPLALSRRRRRRSVLIGAIAVVVLAAVLVVQLLPSSGSNTGSEADAALAQVASVAATRPAEITPGPGHYLYYQTTQLLEELGPPAPKGVRQFLFDVPETTQTWVASNGSGRQRIVVGQPRLAFPSEQAAWQAAGSPAGMHPVGADVLYPSTQAPNGGPLRAAHGRYFLSYLDPSQFPTQPAALEKYMDRYFKIYKESPSATFQLAGNVLQVGASPALRSAIFELIEHLRGVVLLGPTKDPTGRSGTGVAIDGFGNRFILIFNPKTSAVLGEKVVSDKSVTQAGQVIPKGTLLSSETFGTTGVVSSTTTYPDGRPAPPYTGATGASSPSAATFGP